MEKVQIDFLRLIQILLVSVTCSESMTSIMPRVSTRGKKKKKLLLYSAMDLVKAFISILNKHKASELVPGSLPPHSNSLRVLRGDHSTTNTL